MSLYYTRLKIQSQGESKLKKAIIIVTIIFVSTVLVPLIALFNAQSDTNLSPQQTTTQEQTTSKNELVTIFNNPTS